MNKLVLLLVRNKVRDLLKRQYLSVGISFTTLLTHSKGNNKLHFWNLIAFLVRTFPIESTPKKFSFEIAFV